MTIEHEWNGMMALWNVRRNGISTMQDVFGKPKKKARGIFLITILTAAALALLVANG